MKFTEIELKRFRRLFWVGAWVFAGGVLFGVIETLVFLVIHGWHYFPANDTEAKLDFIASTLSVIGIMFMAIASPPIMDDYFKAKLKP